MRRSCILGGLALLLALGISAPAHAFGWKDVVKMQRAGISDDLIIEKIDHSDARFRLDGDDIRELKEAGCSDRVITAMLRTEDRYDDDYSYYHPRTRVFVGLGVGNGWGYGYHRPYAYYPRYYPRQHVSGGRHWYRHHR